MLSGNTDVDDPAKDRQVSAQLREELERCAAAHNDISLKLEQAKDAGCSSEGRFEKVFRLCSDAMLICRCRDARTLAVNHGWETLFGYSRAEAAGRSLRELRIFANDEECIAVCKGIQSQVCIRQRDLKMLDRAGKVRNVLLSGEAFDNAGDVSFIIVMRDVTEQRRIELRVQKQRKQLTHLARVAVLGQLSAALAHELNQPLTAILSNAHAAQRFLAREDVDLNEIRDILQDIVDADRRAGDVIHRLRALFLKGEIKLLPLNLNDVVTEVLSLARSDLIARKIDVALRMEPNLLNVRGDRVQLQQVLLNLITNACEAMMDGANAVRRLAVVTSNSDDGMVRMEISDTGQGIEPHAIDRLFDSFFTTKAHGLGFGLSISRSIITDHDGRIEAMNNKEGGATFRVNLPAHAGEHG
ncbi:PAS domain S-box protein [Noviherbaspirillum cavernae]|uniref:histidine kinase n=1 Tax=Noviherbaspirillum cavernae TaxID=2320862 RepID=A0A418X0S0_9BURK|nr:ATP-binding protein [Noviherbaspirillum cavernae]RJG06069.1 PAS domain S-box protein [Noviherbaspirillum cavernae]